MKIKSDDEEFPTVIWEEDGAPHWSITGSRIAGSPMFCYHHRCFFHFPVVRSSPWWLVGWNPTYSPIVTCIPDFVCSCWNGVRRCRLFHWLESQRADFDAPSYYVKFRSSLNIVSPTYRPVVCHWAFWTIRAILVIFYTPSCISWAWLPSILSFYAQPSCHLHCTLPYLWFHFSWGIPSPCIIRHSHFFRVLTIWDILYLWLNTGQQP